MSDRTQLSKLGTCFALSIAIALSLLVVGPAASTDEAPGWTPIPLQAESETPVLGIAADFDYFSAAWLSPDDESDIDDSNVVNAALAARMVTIEVPRPDGPSELRVFADGQLGEDMMVAVPNEDADDGFYAIEDYLLSVCEEGTVDQENEGYVCDLDPDKWDDPETTKEAVGTTATGADGEPVSADGDEQEWQAGQATPREDQTRIFQLGLMSSRAYADDPGEEAGESLNNWLVDLAGEQLQPEITQLHVSVPGAVRVVPNDSKSPDEQLSADLSWEQCFLPEGEVEWRASCQPDNRFLLALSAVTDDPQDPSDQDGIDPDGSLPSDTTSNSSYGALSPGKVWNDAFTVVNASQNRGWKGESPLIDSETTSPLIFTGLVPRHVTDVDISQEEQGYVTDGECRLMRNDTDEIVKGNFPELAEATSVCAVEKETMLQPMLVRHPDPYGYAPWEPIQEESVRSQYNISYDVPLEMLELAAADPDNWTYVETPVDVMVYEDDEGNSLDEPVKSTEMVGRYESKQVPKLYSWVPQECEVHEGRNLCAAEADARKGSEVKGLRLVHNATAESFVRSICTACWPAPQVVDAAWTSPPASTPSPGGEPHNPDGLPEANAGNANVMQGQSSYLIVNGINGSQTPGHWDRVSVVVDGVPAGVNIEPVKIATAKVTPKGAGKIGDEAEEIDSDIEFEWKKVKPNGGDPLLTCTADGEQEQKVTCVFTKNLAKISDWPKSFNPKRHYAIKFKVSAGLDSDPLEPGEAPYNLQTRFEYPDYKPNESGQTPQLGQDPDDVENVLFSLIPEAEAVVGNRPQVSPQVPDPTKEWESYTGVPVELWLANDSEGEDPEAPDNTKRRIRYVPSNNGDRWVRPDDRLVLDVTLPAGVTALLDRGQVKTDYEVAKDYVTKNKKINGELKSLDEKWTCDKEVTQTQVVDPVAQLELKWDLDHVSCEATVMKGKAGGQQRDDGWTYQNPKYPDLDGAFPAVIFPIESVVETPSEQTDSVATLMVERDNKELGTYETISQGLLTGVSSDGVDLRTLQSNQSIMEIEVVDPNAEDPTIEAYWEARPVAGGHATARIDVANIDRGAAAAMNVLLDFGPGSKFLQQESTSKYWSCEAFEANPQRARCHYSGGLAEGKGKARDDAPRTFPLYVTSLVEEDAAEQIRQNSAEVARQRELDGVTLVPAEDEYTISMRASVFKVRADSPMGSDGGGLSYPLGKPFELKAQSIGSGGDDKTYVLDPPSDDNQLISFDGEIGLPGFDESFFGLDASQSAGPFEGQPVNVRWEQVCVMGAGDPADDEHCDELTPKVKLNPSDDIMRPAFKAPDVDDPTDFKFRVTISDPLIVDDTVRAPPKGFVVPKVAPNSKSGYVTVTVGSDEDEPEPELLEADGQDESDLDPPVRGELNDEQESATPRSEDSPLEDAAPDPSAGTDASSSTAESPKGSRKGGALALCNTFVNGLDKLGVKFVRSLKESDIVAADKNECRLSSGSISIFDTITVNNVSLILREEDLTVESGEVKFPQGWGVEKAEITKSLIFRSGDGASHEGEITGSGFSVGDVEVQDGNQATLVVTFADGDASVTATLPGGLEPTIAGRLTSSGVYELSVSRLKTSFVGGSALELNGAIHNHQPNKPNVKAESVAIDLSGELSGLAMGFVSIPQLEVSYSSQTGYSLKGDGVFGLPGQSSLSVSVEGEYDRASDVLVFSVEGGLESGWSLMPGKVVASGQDVRVVFDAQRESWEVVSGVVVVSGDRLDVIPGWLSLSKLRFRADLASSEVSFGGTARLRGKGESVLVMGASGEYGAREGSESEFEFVFDAVQEGKDAFLLPLGTSFTGVKVHVSVPYVVGDGGESVRGVSSAFVSGDEVVVGGFLTIVSGGVAFDADELAIQQGTTAKLPVSWQMPVVTVTEQLSIPLGQDSEKPYLGEVTAEGFPFADWLGLPRSFADSAKFTMTFDEKGTAFTGQLDGSQMTGRVNRDGSYEFDGSVQNESGSASVQVSCAGQELTAESLKKCSGSASLTDQWVGEHLYLHQIAVSGDGAQGRYEVKGKARVFFAGQSDQDPDSLQDHVEFDVEGKYQEDVAKPTMVLSASGSTNWSVLPGDWKVSGDKISLSKVAGDWQVDAGKFLMDITDAKLSSGPLALTAEQLSVAVDLGDAANVDGTGVVTFQDSKDQLVKFTSTVGYAPTQESATLEINVTQNPQVVADLGSGILLSKVKGQVKRTSYEQEDKEATWEGSINGGLIDFNKFVTIENLNASFDPDKIEIGSGKISLEPSWQMPQLSITDGKPLVITTDQDGDSHLVGGIEALGFPFAKEIPVQGLENTLTTVEFTAAEKGEGKVSTKTTVRVLNENDRDNDQVTPYIFGDILDGDNYTLAVDTGQAAKVPGLGTLELKGKIIRGPPPGKDKPTTTFDVAGSLTDVRIGDFVSIPELSVSYKTGAGLKLSGEGEFGLPGQSSFKVSVKGDFQSDVLVFSVEGGLESGWSLMPGKVVASGQDVRVVFDAQRESWEVVSGVVVVSGDRLDVIPGWLSLSKLRFRADLASSEVSFGGTARLRGKGESVLVMGASGEYGAREGSESEFEFVFDAVQEGKDAFLLPLGTSFTGVKVHVSVPYVVGDGGESVRGVSSAFVSGDEVVVGGFLTIVSGGVAFDADELAIQQGTTAKLPVSWQMPVVTVTEQLSIPLGQDSEKPYLGEVTAEGFPFADWLGLPRSFADSAKFTMTFDEKGTAFTGQLDGSQMTGRVNRDGSYEFDGSVQNESGSASVQVSCAGQELTAESLKKCSGSASLTDQWVGEHLYLHQIAVSGDGAQGRYEVKGKARVFFAGQSDQDPDSLQDHVEFDVEGKYQEDVAKPTMVLSASGSTNWSVLPGDWKVSGDKISLSKVAGDWQVDAGKFLMDITDAKLSSGPLALTAEQLSVAVDLGDAANVDGTGVVTFQDSKDQLVKFTSTVGYAPTQESATLEINVTQNPQVVADLGSGILLSKVKGQVKRTSYEQEDKEATWEGSINGGLIDFNKFVTIENLNASFDPDKIEIGSGKISLEPSWQMPQLSITDGKPLVITTDQDGDSHLVGGIEALGFPFAKEIPVQGLENTLTTVEFTAAEKGEGKVSTKTTVRVLNENDRDNDQVTPYIFGDILDGDNYTLAVDTGQAAKVPGLGTLELKGKIIRGPPPGKDKPTTTFDVAAAIKDVNIADVVAIDTLGVEFDDQSNFKLMGEARISIPGANDPILMDVTGSYESADEVIKLQGAVSLPSVSFLPDETKLKLDLTRQAKEEEVDDENSDDAELEYEWVGSISAVTEGETTLAENIVGLRDFGFAIQFPSAEFKASGQLVVYGADSKKPLLLDISGGYEDVGDKGGGKVSLVAEQAEDQSFVMTGDLELQGISVQVDFEKESKEADYRFQGWLKAKRIDVESGVRLVDLELAFKEENVSEAYSSENQASSGNSSEEGRNKDTDALSRALTGTVGVQVDVPQQDNEFTANANFSLGKQGFMFEGELDGSWNVTEGLDINKLQLGYRSSKNPGPFNPAGKELADVSIKSYRGLLISGTVASAPGSFMHDVMGAEGELTSYARVDTNANAYEMAIESQGQIHVYGDPSSDESSSMAIDKPYLKVVYAKSPKAENPPNSQTEPTGDEGSAAEETEPELSIAMGGTGSFKYPSRKPNNKVEEYKGLHFSASTDLAKGTIAGKIYMDDWNDAGGITGLTIKDAEVQLTRDEEGQTTASVFASVAGGGGDPDQPEAEMPQFFKLIGLAPDAPISVGFTLGENFCAMLSIGESPEIGDADSRDVALQPFTVVHKDLKKLLTVYYAQLVAATGECSVGGQSFTDSTMVVSADILGLVPVNLNLDVDTTADGENTTLTKVEEPREDEEPAREDPDESTDTDELNPDIEAMPMGPATMSEVSVGVSLDTKADKNKDMDLASTTKGARRAGGGGPELRLTGSMPVGNRKLTVAGKVGKPKDAKEGRLKISLGGQIEDVEGQEVEFGKFKVTSGGVNVGLVVNTGSGRTVDVNDGLDVSLAGQALILKKKMAVTLGMEYGGGSIQSMSGFVSMPNGVAIGDRVVIKGGGSVEWDAATGLDVIIGEGKGSLDSLEEGEGTGAASVLVCGGKAKTTKLGGNKGEAASCDSGGAYGMEDAFVAVTPAGFAAQGTLKIGKYATATLTGAYFTDDETKGRALLSVGEDKYVPREGDYSFGAEGVTIKLPTGNVTGGLSIANFHDDQGIHQNRGAMEFKLPILGGEVFGKGTFQTNDAFRVEGGAEGLRMGGFGVEDGNVRVTNYEGDNPDGYDPESDDPVDIDLDLQTTLGSWGGINFKGKMGREDNSVGVRVDGRMKLKASVVSSDAEVIYSSFPYDAGFGVGFQLEIKPAKIDVSVSGIFRKVDDEVLYRVGGGLGIPVAGVQVKGALRMDNCDNNQAGAICVNPRTDKAGNLSSRIGFGGAVAVGGDFATVKVSGEIGFDGKFRFVGRGEVGASMGPWGFFGVITAEAGFSMIVSVCIANALQKTMGCGVKQDQTWVTGIYGSAYAMGKINLILFSITARFSAKVMGVASQHSAKFCAGFGMFGYDVVFGKCPSPQEIPQVDPSLIDGTLG